MVTTSAQIRAARAMLHLEQAELALRAHVSVMTIRRLEAPGGRSRVSQATVDGIRAALEAAGAEFIPGGVRVRPADRPDSGARFERLRAISLRSAALLQEADPPGDAALYDENGLPA